MRSGLCSFIGMMVTSAAACGPAVEQPLTPLATCGEDGPVRVLEHGPDWSSSTGELFGDELIVRVAPVGWRGMEPTDETWLVGKCGENPRHIAQGLQVHWQHGVLISLDAYERLGPRGDIFRIDPNGELPPFRLFEDVWGSVLATEHGWLVPDYESDELWLHRDPVAGQQPAELVADDVASFVGACGVSPSRCESTWEIRGPVIYYVNFEHELTEVTLDTGERRVAGTNANWAWVTPDGAHLWWKERGESDDGDSSAPVHRRNLSTGADDVVYVGRAPRYGWPFMLTEIGADADRSLIDARTATIHPLPPEMWKVFSRPGIDGLLVAGTEAGDSYAWSNEERHAIPLGPSRGSNICWRDYSADGLDVLRKASCDDGVGELWFTPYGGGEARLVAAGVSEQWAHFDGRVVWSTPKHRLSEQAHVGDLFVETEGAERLRLDTDARLNSWRWPSLDDGWMWTNLDGDVLYTVNDGDRSGLWRTATR